MAGPGLGLALRRKWTLPAGAGGGGRQPAAGPRCFCSWGRRRWLWDSGTAVSVLSGCSESWREQDSKLGGKHGREQEGGQDPGCPLAASRAVRAGAGAVGLFTPIFVLCSSTGLGAPRPPPTLLSQVENVEQKTEAEMGQTQLKSPVIKAPAPAASPGLSWGLSLVGGWSRCPAVGDEAAPRAAPCVCSISG